MNGVLAHEEVMSIPNSNTHLDDGYYSGAASIGVAVLAFFAFFRPLTVSFHHIGTVSILDIFGITSSYMMLIALLLNLRSIRLPAISYIIIFYVFYCLLSVFWGSEYRDVVRSVVPFLPFFLVVAVVRKQRHVVLLISAMSLGYLLPVIGSIILIALGKSDIIVTGSALERQAGLSSGVHTTGHLMLFYSFVFAFYHIVNKDIGRFKQLMVGILFLGSIVCLYKTYTRTVYVGGLIFWLSFLWIVKKKYCFIAIIAISVIAIVKYSDIHSMVVQKKWNSDAVDVDTISSGRSFLWKHNLSIYSTLPLTTQLLGVGIGNELKEVPGTHTRWAGSHNDYLSLLVTVGLFGVLLYLAIYAINLLMIFRSGWHKNIITLATSIQLSVITMNFVSNSYIVRFQMAQLFWFMMGLIYVYGWIQIKNHSSTGVVFKEEYLASSENQLLK